MSIVTLLITATLVATQLTTRLAGSGSSTLVLQNNHTFELDCSKGTEAIRIHNSDGGFKCFSFTDCDIKANLKCSNWTKGDRVYDRKLKQIFNHYDCRLADGELTYAAGIRYTIRHGRLVHNGMQLKCCSISSSVVKHTDHCTGKINDQGFYTTGKDNALLISYLDIPREQKEQNKIKIKAYKLCHFTLRNASQCKQQQPIPATTDTPNGSAATVEPIKMTTTKGQKEEEKEVTQSEKDRRIVERVRREIEERNRKMKPITTTPKPKPKPPLTKAEKIIANTSRDLGCAFMVLACLISIGISICLRNSFSERILHLCQELCLICEHLTMFLTLWGMDEGKKNQCYLTSTLMQFFGVANMAFIFLESLDAYGVITNLVFQGNLFPTQTYIFTGFAIPLGIFIPTALWLYEEYPSESSCWINWSHRAVATTFAMSIFILGMCAIILAEMAGMWKNTIIIERNRKRVHLARINRMGVLMIVPLQFVSELVGSFAMHHMNLLLIAQVLIFNIILAVTVLAAHTIGNKQVYDALLKLWGKMRKKRPQP